MLALRPKETYFDAFDNLRYFGEDISRALPYFHALTGCDRTFTFYQVGKAKFRKTWMKQHNSSNESLTKIFKSLGDQPTNIDSNDIGIIAKYIYNRYGQDISSGTVKPCVYGKCTKLPTSRAFVPYVPHVLACLTCLRFYIKCGTALNQLQQAGTSKNEVE